MKYLLAICIPNYNRIDKLKRLLEEIIGQICSARIERKIQICISDDASEDSPDNVIETFSQNYSNIKILYKRNRENKGMDYNFLQSVLMSESKYCWIIGNDDLPEKNALYNIVSLLEKNIYYNEISLIITSFHVYSSLGEYKRKVSPLKSDKTIYSWKTDMLKSEFVANINHESAVFAFLSNAIFCREDWEKHIDMFSDKMNTIFIQMYMNLQTLVEGGNYLYVDMPIIKNYIDESPSGGLTMRMYRIALGLYDVLQYFFKRNECKYLQEKIVTPFIRSEFWDDIDKYKEISFLKIKKVEIYNKYYKTEQYIKTISFTDLVVFGAGKKGRENIRYLKSIGRAISMIIDNEPKFHGSKIDNIIVREVKESVSGKLLESNSCQFVVSSYNIDIINDMIKQLLFLGVDEENILII